MTIVSMGLVFAESKILFNMGFPPTPKTVSFVIPDKNKYRLEEIFPMDIDVSNIKTPINAIQSDLSFEPSKMQVVEVTTDDSLATIFIQKEINNEAGYVRLSGGLPNPGYTEDHGHFGTVYFQGKSPGLATVEFLPSSMVLANDGRGTNIIKDLAKISYLILPDKISPQEEELQKSLYVSKKVLGERSTMGTQLLLYSENNPQVLGAVDKNVSPITKMMNWLAHQLEEVDAWTVNFWYQIFRYL